MTTVATSKPWENEPDGEAFRIGDVIGAVRRTPGGYLCGYVALPEDHELYGADYSEIDQGFRPHGGWTFAAPAEVEDRKMWVLGFDASHGFDYSPSLDMPTGMPDEIRQMLDKIGDTRVGPESYRTFDYMRDQAQRAAISLAKIDNSDEIEVIPTNLLL